MKRLTLICFGAMLCMCLAAQDITLMSFNIRTSSANAVDGVNAWTNRKEAALQLTKDRQPDVFGLQEAMPDQEAYFREQLAPDYDGVAVSRNPERPDEACPVFFRTDRFELLRTNTFWLSETPDVPSKGWDAMFNRVVTYVHLRDKQSGQIYLVFNTHLDHVGVVARERSLQLIADSAIAIGNDTVPMFVMGDLNVTPDAPELAPMWNYMKLAMNEAPLTEHGYTYHNWGQESDKMIDYIFLRNATALRFCILHNGYGAPFVSDHYPILTVCRPAGH